MALINCPECNKEISNQAKICVHCGYPLPKEFATTENPVKKPGNFTPEFAEKILSCGKKADLYGKNKKNKHAHNNIDK